MTFIRILTFAALLLTPFHLVRGQPEGLLKILNAVDEKQRPQLAKRLRLFIDLHRKKQWDEVYKLVDRGNAEHWRGRDFATMMSGFGYVDFIPTGSATDDNHGYQYRVFGCVKVETEEKPVWLKSGTVAYLQGGDWYFTPFYLQFDGKSSRLPCQQAIDPSLTEAGVPGRRSL